MGNLMSSPLATYRPSHANTPYRWSNFGPDHRWHFKVMLIPVLSISILMQLPEFRCSHWFRRYMNPDPSTNPDWDNPPTFDPQMGFPEGRKEKVGLSVDEMNRNFVHPNRRDYCAQYDIAQRRCEHANSWLLKAHHCRKEIYDYKHCEYYEYVDRLKEYERERRLLVRQKKLQLQEEAVQ